ncbi:MAG: TonB-dependent receptor plug domain-containing protein, partial [Longimicrobiales bacterium]
MPLQRSIVPPAICALLVLAWSAGTAGASLASARQTEPRSLLARRAHLSVERVPLEEALRELARRSGVSLAYSPSLLPAGRNVECSCTSLSVADALALLLAGTGFGVREGDGQVILSPARGAMPVARGVDADFALRQPAGALGVVRTVFNDESPPTFAVAEPALVRAATITGRVTGESDAPVLGVSVTSLRTGLGATTDAAGNYRIVVPTERIIAGPDTLRFERLGYETTDVPYTLADGDIRVDAVLPLEAVALDQILVTGTAGNQERRAQAAVIGSIDASELAREAPIANVTQLLQARLPGITATESSGTTGAAARINIRGAASISLSNQPLIFVDGVRVDGGTRGLVNVSGGGTVGQAPSALNDLNPA